jgi:hypothetical protein
MVDQTSDWCSLHLQVSANLVKQVINKTESSNLVKQVTGGAESATDLVKNVTVKAVKGPAESIHTTSSCSHGTEAGPVGVSVQVRLSYQIIFCLAAACARGLIQNILPQQQRRC